MTTTASGRKLTSACNGVTTNFANPKLRGAGDLRVYLLDDPADENGDGTLLSEGSHYTLATDLGSITTLTAYPAGKYIRRWRETSRAQQVEIVANQAVPAATQEDALDRLSLVDEEQDDDLGRAVMAPPGDAIEVLPLKSVRAGKYFAFDADGNPVAASGTGNDAALRTDLADATKGSLLILHKSALSSTFARSARSWAAVGGMDDGNVFNWIDPSLDAAILDRTSVADVAAYLQNAFNSGLPIRLTRGAFNIGSNLTLPASLKLSGAGRGATLLQTAANIAMLTVNGAAVALRGLSILHAGNGLLVDAALDDDLVIEDCELLGTSAGATASMILTSGSFLGLRRNVITNNRVGSSSTYALKLDRTGVTLNIESHVQQNRIGGNGKGIWIGSSDNSARPEGLNLVSNSLFCLKPNLTIEQLLQATIMGNVFDQGDVEQVVLKPVGSGIQDIEIIGNWLSTPNQTVNGVALNHDTSGGGSIDGVALGSNSFVLTGYGAVFKSSASNVTLDGNSFTTCGTGIKIDQAAKVTIGGNTFKGIVTQNVELIDGAAGGPFTVDNNMFDPAKPVTLTRTSNAKFILGAGNTGKKLAGWASVDTDTTAKPSGSTVNIPHGLAAAPDKAKIITSIVGKVAVFSAATQPIVTAVDGTNITVLVTFTAGTPGSYAVNAMAAV